MNEFLGLFTRASKLMRAAADEAMSRHGVRVGQNLVLEVLWETDGLTPGELAQRLHLATPTVVKSATRMEATGLLTRHRDEHDARLVRLYLTEQARSVRNAIETERDALARRATAGLTDAEQRVLKRALTKIIEEFADHATGPADDVPGSRG
jgi:MarR family transcriptional regulator, organic hydroperoxide resistance regulator